MGYPDTVPYYYILINLRGKKVVKKWKPKRPIDEAYTEEWLAAETEITNQLILESM